MARISVCMIARDEERVLSDCLDSVRPWVEEICLVDTGSRDRTRELAEAAGARVRDFPWCDDFSAARNASLEMATGDWILVIDADEVLAEESGPILRRLSEREDAQAFLVWQDNLDAHRRPQPVAVPRLFRNRPEIRFSRPVHESVMESLLALSSGPLECAEVHLEHRGYLPEVLAGRDKHARNLRILRAQFERRPDDLFNAYKLAATLRKAGPTAEEERAWERALELAEALDEPRRAAQPFLPMVYAGCARSLLERGRLARAREVTEAGARAFPEAVELRWIAGELARCTGDLAAAEAAFRGCLEASAAQPVYSGDPAARTWKPALGLARTHGEAGDLEAAASDLERALSFEPSDPAARALLLRVRLAQGREAEGLAELAALMEEAPTHPEVQLAGGEIAWMQGQHDTARDLWRAAAGGDEAGNQARAHLALAHLARGALGEAQEEVAALVARDLSTAACRLLVGVVCGRELELDPAFPAEGLCRALVPWLRELVEAPDSKAARRFAERAPAAAGRVPGIERLLVEDG